MNTALPYTTKNHIRLAFILVILAGNPAFAGSASLPDPLKAGWRGEPVCEHLSEDTLNRVLRCTFPPGVGHERHYHVPHFGYAISGGRVTIRSGAGTRTLELTTGSHFNSPGTLWHEVQNIGDTTIIYLIVEQKDGSLDASPAD